MISMTVDGDRDKADGERDWRMDTTLVEFSELERSYRRRIACFPHGRDKARPFRFRPMGLPCPLGGLASVRGGRGAAAALGFRRESGERREEFQGAVSGHGTGTFGVRVAVTGTRWRRGAVPRARGGHRGTSRGWDDSPFCKKNNNRGNCLLGVVDFPKHLKCQIGEIFS